VQDGQIFMSHVLIFANGELPDLERARPLIHSDDYIICADGGTYHALALGLRPDLVIGDMDSLAKNEWKQLEQTDVALELHPRDKDETDLELALNRALEQKPDSIVVIAALGIRLDQTIANLTLLSDPRLSTLDARLDDGVEQVLFCRAACEIRGTSGDLVSLIPWNGPVHGIRTSGLRWPLKDETLYPARTRGLSNEMLNEVATVSIASELLLIVHHRQT
jgi:thiamine pyrophosphokinase